MNKIKMKLTNLNFKISKNQKVLAQGKKIKILDLSFKEDYQAIHFIKTQL